MYTLNGYRSNAKFSCPECEELLDHEDPAYEDALLCDVKTPCVYCEEKREEKERLEKSNASKFRIGAFNYDEIFSDIFGGA